MGFEPGSTMLLYRTPVDHELTTFLNGINGSFINRNPKKKEKVCAYSKDLDQLSVKLKDTVFKKVFWNICLQEIFVFETVLRSRGTEACQKEDSA